jgi:hypothetical protein
MKAKLASVLVIALVPVILSIVQWRSPDVSAVVFYALLPGNIVSLLITGGHGGTEFEEAVAPFVGAAVNVGVYSMLVLALLRARQTRKDAHGERF